MSMELDFKVHDLGSPQGYTVSEVLQNWQEVLSQPGPKERIDKMVSFGSNRRHANRIEFALGDEPKKWERYLNDLIAFHYGGTKVDIKVKGGEE